MDERPFKGRAQRYRIEGEKERERRDREGDR
jgi:hypothetical protein